MKSKRVVFIIIVVLCSLLLTVNSVVIAIPLPPGGPKGVAEGAWVSNSGTEIPMVEITTPNSSWLQLLSNGIKVAQPQEICHPFWGGQNGWTGEIYELIGEGWKKIETSGRWGPNEEGKFMACAYAPEAGTYALFGYYTKPKDECGDYYIAYLTIYEQMDGGYLLAGSISPAVAHIRIKYNFSDSGDYMEGALSGSTYTDNLGNFEFPNEFYFTDSVPIQLHMNINGCPVKMKE
jgi:hypothetical protein